MKGDCVYFTVHTVHTKANGSEAMRPNNGTDRAKNWDPGERGQALCFQSAEEGGRQH